MSNWAQRAGVLTGMAKACPYKTPYERSEALVEGRKAHKTIYLCSACKKWHLSKKDGEPKLTKAEKEQIILDNNERLTKALIKIEELARVQVGQYAVHRRAIIEVCNEALGTKPSALDVFVDNPRPMLPTPPEDLDRMLSEWEEQDGPVDPEITADVQRKLADAEVPDPVQNEIIVTVERMVDMGVNPDDALRTVLNDRQRQREEGR